MGNIHFYEILDWFVGWAGFDVSKDDSLTAYRLKEQGKLPPAEPKDDEGLIQASAPKPPPGSATALAAEQARESSRQPAEGASRPSPAGSGRGTPPSPVRVSSGEPFPAAVAEPPRKPPVDTERLDATGVTRRPFKESVSDPAPKRIAAPPERKHNHDLKELVP